MCNDIKENRNFQQYFMDFVVTLQKWLIDEGHSILAERRLIIEKHTKSYRGRIFNTAGDAFRLTSLSSRSC
ncbi:MAG: hypothetical protein CM15mP124_0140 [Alphaproteobacteria bacterium]|nr:MAG: hypothetical protein CM15mP124_0140 [Alphaproteobacteria bacterium]